MQTKLPAPPLVGGTEKSSGKCGIGQGSGKRDRSGRLGSREWWKGMELDQAVGTVWEEVLGVNWMFDRAHCLILG